jgi:hypothetical protein
VTELIHLCSANYNKLKHLESTFADNILKKVTSVHLRKCYQDLGSFDLKQSMVVLSKEKNINSTFTEDEFYVPKELICKSLWIILQRQ